MNLYYNLLKAFLNYEVYKKYSSLLDYKTIKENYPETFKLFQTLRHLHDQRAQDYTLDDVELNLYTLYPQARVEEFAPILQRIRECDASEESLKSYLHEVHKREMATVLARNALAVSEGREGADLVASISAYESSLGSVVDEKTEEDFVNDDLVYLQTTQNTTPGLRWRLGSLNRNLGSLRQGDFGFVFARPETGKTTFLASEVSFMAEQTDRLILWFNNEEQGGKVQLRCYQASLGLPLLDLYRDTNGNKTAYTERTGNRLRIIADPTITRKRVEELCDKYSPALVIFDQIDKIKGFSEDRNDLELKAIYEWAREIAKRYCPVIGICQAGASGDFKRWLTMNDVDNSKTGKQGEADWILGIGKVADEGLEQVRYLHLSKNKLLGDQDADPSQRHGKWEVKIEPEIARYTDFTH
jgi:replicative DNA helicase